MTTERNPQGYTPGPWKAAPFSSVVGCPITAQPDPKQNTIVVAGTRGAFGEDYRGEIEANARLIASAPELLAALEGMLAVHDMTQSPAGDRIAAWSGAVNLARAAIAKATAPVKAGA